MADQLASDTYLAKAQECLEGAESELLNSRYNNCANRSYYACFQAAVAALTAAGVRPRGQDGRWGHDFVAAQFSQQLINRRKRYPSDLGDTLERLFRVRRTADYKTENVTRDQATRVLRRARVFVQTIQSQ